MKRKSQESKKTHQMMNDDMCNMAFEEMVKAGVLKVVGRKLEHGRMVDVYGAVPQEEWPPEGHALMFGSEGGTNRSGR